MSRRLEGKRILVTGASSGIGEAVARACVGEGAAVVITSEREQDLFAVAEALKKSGGQVLPVVVDFTKPEEVATLLERIERDFGALDVVVNNAGVGLGASISEMRERDLRFVFEVNFFAFVSVCQQALKAMSARKQGRIINLTSASARLGMGGVAAYAASKGAAHNFTTALRMEAKPHGVLVSEVLPISVRTKFFDNVKGDAYQPKGVVQTPEHVAECVVRCAASSRAMAEVLPYRLVRFAFIFDAALPGFIDRFLKH